MHMFPFPSRPSSSLQFLPFLELKQNLSSVVQLLLTRLYFCCNVVLYVVVVEVSTPVGCSVILNPGKSAEKVQLQSINIFDMSSCGLRCSCGMTPPPCFVTWPLAACWGGVFSRANVLLNDITLSLLQALKNITPRLMQTVWQHLMHGSAWADRKIHSLDVSWRWNMCIDFTTSLFYHFFHPVGLEQSISSVITQERPWLLQWLLK